MTAPSLTRHTYAQDVAEAYEVLSDKEKKARYDAGVDLEDLDNPHAHGGGFGGFGGGGGMHGIDPNILFEVRACCVDACLYVYV